MRARIDELANTDVVLITFTDPTNLADYEQRHRVDLLTASDPSRRSYQAYGLRRGSIVRVWGLKAAKRYFEILRADRSKRLARPTEDTLQLGGDFIIDPDGTLIYGFWSDGPDDRPDVDELIAAIEATRTP